MIEPCTSIDQPGWLSLRQTLWSEGSRSEHLAEMASFLAEPQRFAQFIYYVEPDVPAGFVEAALRYDYVNGTESSPVAFLEGIFVLPAHRRQGIAGRLVAAVERWAISRGCREFASDAALVNELSHAVHRSLGFRETERVVYFRKLLHEH